MNRLQRYLDWKLAGIVTVCILAVSVSAQENQEATQAQPTAHGIRQLIRTGVLEDIERALGSAALEAADAAADDAASQEGALRVAGVYPLPGMRLKEEIIIFFDEALAPLPEVGGVPQLAVAVRPNLEGHIHIRENCLYFSSPLLKAVAENSALPEITLSLNPNLKSVSGRPLHSEDRKLTLQNVQVAIDNVRLGAITDEAVTLQVGFTHLVDVEQLSELVTLTDSDGEAVPCVVRPGSDGMHAEIDLPRDTNFPVALTVQYGLRWGTTLDQTAGLMRAAFPRKGLLELRRAQYLGGTPPRLSLSFSSSVRAQTAAEMVEVTNPRDNAALTLRAEDVSGTTVVLAVEHDGEDDPLQRIMMRIPPFMPSMDMTTLTGKELRDTLNLLVQTDQQAPLEQETVQTQKTPLHVRYHYWNESSIDGYQLQVGFNNTVSPEALERHFEVTPPVKDLRFQPGSWSGHVLVQGDWKSNHQYILHLKAGLESANKTHVLRQDVQEALDETPFNSGAEFDSPKQFYYLRQEQTSPRVKARNITEAKVTLAQIFPSNIPVFVRDYLAGQDDYYGRDNLLDAYAGELGVLNVNFPDVKDKTFSVPIDMDGLMPADQRGVFIMSLDPLYGWQNGQRILVYTDMGALAHWTDGELVVFVHDLFTLASVAQAKVTVYSNKFQSMGVSATGEDGVARLGDFDPFLGVPALVIIEKGEDYTFLDLREKLDHRTPFTPSMPYFDRDGYDAYLHLDRNLYRPGETVHIRWITRTRYVDALADVPLQMRIANPQGRWIYEMPVTLSEVGTGGFDFQSERVHPTGKYTVELRVPEAPEPIGTASFNLEEFVPNRLKATATFDRERLAPEGKAVLTVVAENLFGGFASGRKTEGRVFLRPMQYESKDWPGYFFGNEDELEKSLYPLGESITDQEGKSTFEYTFEPEDDATMPLEVVASGRVLELGGRAVTDSTRAIAIPDGVMLGLSVAPRPDREILDVHVLALNTEDKPAGLTTVQVTLERQTWNYYLRRLQDRNDPRWEKVFQQVKTYDVTLQDGKGTLELPYPHYGEYRLRVHSPETRMYSTLMFNRWWGQLKVESASRPELIRLTANQESYRAGDRLDLRIESPYDGIAYIVAQGDRFRETMTVPVQDGEGKALFTVPHTWFPNAWLQVTVVRNAQNQEVAHYPYSSFSMINVPLDDPDRRIEAAFVDLPEEILPAQPFEVVLETKDQDGNPVAAEITVAAVDEGIHSILGYDNPDPYAHFQRTRKFDVRQAHYYDKVFYEPDASAIGGDMMRRLGLTSQVDENWIRPVALWSGVVHSDETGRAAIVFDVPEFIGQLRLVAVAVTERAVGVAAKPVLVRRPHLLRTSMPRFALSGDRFECTAVAMNLSEAPITARVAWSASGTLSGAGEKALELAPGGEGTFRVPVTAASAPGQGFIDWTLTVVDASGAVVETLTERAPLPVRPPAAYQSETEFITLMPGEKRIIENAVFHVDPVLHTKIEVSNDLFLRLRPGLKYLLRFPYGCVEQTVSRAMPLYFLRNYARLYEDMFIGDMEAARMASNAEMYLSHTIQRLMTMQTVDGGISFWPGSSTSYPYGSVYALHFLTLVRRDHAFQVYDTAFRNLQRNVLEILKNDLVTTASDYYLRAYACYVLALDGNLEAMEYAQRFDTVKVPESARYLLAAAKAMHSSQPEGLLEYLDTAPMAADGARESSGTLHSSVRADAVKLIALLQMNAPMDRIQPLMNSLVTYLADTRQFTTQEAAFAITALSLMLEKHTADPGEASVRIIDADGDRVITGEDLFTKSLAGVAPRFEIANEGSVPAYIYVEMAGNPLAPRLTPTEKGVTISREFLHEDGSAVSGAVFGHGGQYMVQITLIPRRAVENLLVTDLLPAGFEVANPRLEADKQPELKQGANANLIVTPDFLEVRDDRVALALDRLDAKVHVFRYLVRAVTPGRFQLPALHVEGMYTPDIQATTVPTEITVE